MQHCNKVNLINMEAGYKDIRTNKILDLDLRENSFGIEPEITIKLAKKNCKFFEVSISYNGRSYQEGKKIGLKDAFIVLYCILNEQNKTK